MAEFTYQGKKQSADGPEAAVQRKGGTVLEDRRGMEQPVQRKASRSGLPDHVKQGVEALSGMTMDHVRVHYNSSRPAQLNAHAYAQGSDIHLAPGQEQHVAHEAWHVVQQAQGRVKPTMKVAGTSVNDSASLEAEADRMGDHAASMSAQMKRDPGKAVKPNGPAQLMKIEGATKPATKKDKYKDLEPGTRRTFEERYFLETGNRLNMTEQQITIYDVLAGQDVVFKDVTEFMDELNKLHQNWGGQRFFYETPKKGRDNVTAIKKYGNLTGQNASTDIKLYSARKTEDVQALYNWAVHNGITTEGFDDFEIGEATDAPFKGHFGDRSHTVKHYRQKKSQGSSANVICVHLNGAASNELRGVRDRPDFITGGGEGSSAGGFGLKSENNFVSVALGKSAATWNHLKNKITKIELVKTGDDE